MSFLWWSKPEQKVKSEIDKAIDNFHNLQPDNFTAVYSASMSIYRIYAIEPHIGEYVALLEKIISALEHDILLLARELPFEVKSIYLREFFLDEQSCYIDAKYYSTEFIDKAVTLLQLYAAKEKATGKTFETEKNLFLIRNIINNLIQISKELTQIFN